MIFGSWLNARIGGRKPERDFLQFGHRRGRDDALDFLELHGEQFQGLVAGRATRLQQFVADMHLPAFDVARLTTAGRGLGFRGDRSAPAGEYDQTRQDRVTLHRSQLLEVLGLTD